jgi:Cd2+/Zn2+-exporting ATPase
MDCPSCASKIETAMRRLDGVDGVRVNYHSQVLAFRLDEAVTPRLTIEEKVRSLGYGVRPVEALQVIGSTVAVSEFVEAKEVPWWQGGKARLALAIGLLVLLGAAVSRTLPSVGAYAEAPAALLGLWFFGGHAIRLAQAGSPFSIEMLMSIATVGAILIGAPSEAAVVVLLFTAGQLLEGIAAGRARAGIRALSALVPRVALLIEDGGVREVSASSLQIGQLVLVRPGDRVPTDGIVIEGGSEADESPVTGESMPVPKQEDDILLAGSINGSGALQMRVTRTATDNTIARIVHMVEEAQASRAPIARFIERFSVVYTPAVVAVAVLAAVAPPLWLGTDWHTWIYRGLALLLIGCPCALVLSTPAAITSGIAAGARRGLLIKGGAALETIGRVRAVAFDKTGTLTRGEPHVTDLHVFSGSERTLLGLAASAENGSSHPIARAILARATADGIPLRPALSARVLPGQAVTAQITGKLVAVGSSRYAAAATTLSAEAWDAIAVLEAAGKTVVVIMVDQAPIGLIAVRDEPRPDAKSGLAALRALGVQPVMLTGDNSRTGAAIAAELGIEALTQLLPDDKLREVTAMKSRAPVAMVGDGINDAPALAAASVGIAMGSGTDVALETADAALLSNSVADVAALVRLSRATMHNIWQNVGIALGLKLVFLVTTLTGSTNLWVAILADTGATVIVTLNALRLLRHRV